MPPASSPKVVVVVVQAGGPAAMEEEEEFRRELFPAGLNQKRDAGQGRRKSRAGPQHGNVFFLQGDIEREREGENARGVVPPQPAGLHGGV